MSKKNWTDYGMTTNTLCNHDFGEVNQDIKNAAANYDKAVEAYLNSEISYNGLQHAKKQYDYAQNSSVIIW